MRANFILHYLGHFTLFFYQKIPDIWNLARNNSKYLEFSTIKFHFFLFYYKEKTGKFPMPSPLSSFHPLSARIYPMYA